MLSNTSTRNIANSISSIILGVAVVSIVFFTVGCTGPSSSRGSDGPRIQANDKPSSIKVPAVEQELGLSLPSGSMVLYDHKSDESYYVSIQTPLTFQGSIDYFDSEVKKLGFRIVREWGSLPSDNNVDQNSATYDKNGELLGLGVVDEGDTRTITFQIQY